MFKFQISCRASRNDSIRCQVKTVIDRKRSRRWRLRWRRSVAVQRSTSTCWNVAPDWLACCTPVYCGRLYIEDALSSASLPIRRIHFLHLEFSTDVTQISHVVHNLRLCLKHIQRRLTITRTIRRLQRRLKVKHIGHVEFKRLVIMGRNHSLFTKIFKIMKSGPVFLTQKNWLFLKWGVEVQFTYVAATWTCL